MPIDAQRFSQTPGVEPIRFVGGRNLALPVGFGAPRIDRVNGHFALEQLLHGSPLVGLHDHGHRRIVADLGTESVPTFQRVLEFELCHDLPLTVDHRNLVVVFGPVEAEVVCYFIPVFHRRSFRPPP